ncbi:MAG: MBL fold metallo-hydrolase [Clostridiales bacterium]|nr:MBL fold metallo-hydrolase [Clostridiales bacterium]
MKDGIYGVYNGEVHRIGHNSNGELLLFPAFDNETDSTFADGYHAGACSKIIKPEDLSEAYELRSYAEYRGYKTFIARSVGDEYEIYVNDHALAQELGFDRCDKYAYNMMVKKTDVKVITEKIPYSFDQKKTATTEPRIRYLIHGGTTCYLLKTEGSTLLIDTGLFGNLKALDRWLGGCKVDYVFLTHGHADHDWNARALQKRGAKIILSEKDKDLPRHFMSQPVKPTMPKYRFRNFTQLVSGSVFRTHRYTPDILIGDDRDYLKSLGFDAQIIPLPGHTYGSLGILSDNILYCGDAFTALWKKPDITPHAVSIELMKESLRKILEIDPERLACGHGWPVSMEAARPVIESYLAEYR